MKSCLLLLAFLFLSFGVLIAKPSNSQDSTQSKNVNEDSKTTTNSAGMYVFIILAASGYITFKVFQSKQRKELIAKMVERYPDYENEIRTKFSRSKKVSTNMPYEVVEFIFGKPGDMKESFNGKKLKINCFYFGHYSKRGKLHFSFRIDFEGTDRSDLRVAGWKELV